METSNTHMHGWEFPARETPQGRAASFVELLPVSGRSLWAEVLEPMACWEGGQEGRLLMTSQGWAGQLLWQEKVVGRGPGTWSHFWTQCYFIKGTELRQEDLATWGPGL
jgi:hypothetical protein